MIIRISLFISVLLISQALEAQELLKRRPSPLGIASVRYKDNYVKITYSQPQKHNRKIFGELVPFGNVWRTGANEATEITTTQDIIFGSELLSAGTYSLFTIPEENQWTIIINADVGLWGAYNYNAEKDIRRFAVQVQETEEGYEAFTIRFDQQNELAKLLIIWDRTKVSIPIEFIK